LVEACAGVVYLFFEISEAGKHGRGVAVILDSSQQVAGAGSMRFDRGLQGGALLLHPSTGGMVRFGHGNLDRKQIIEAEGAL
jgi:hypothetical protein